MNRAFVVNAAGAVQGIVLVTAPAASNVFTDPRTYDLSSARYGAMFVPQAATAITAFAAGHPADRAAGAAVAAAVSGGVIAGYQLGYGIAAFGIGPVHTAGVSLSTVYGATALVAMAMGVLAIIATRSGRGVARSPHVSRVG